MPKKLQKDLPYRLKPKLDAATAPKKRARDVPDIVRRNTAVILEPHESRINKLMEVFHKVKEDTDSKERAALQQRQEKHKKVGLEVE